MVSRSRAAAVVSAPLPELIEKSPAPGPGSIEYTTVLSGSVAVMVVTSVPEGTFSATGNVPVPPVIVGAVSSTSVTVTSTVPVTD